MALQWNWEESVGDAIFEVNNEREVRITLYEGNALLIMLQEYQEDGEDMYNMFGFWVDKAHMKNCLGLAKGYDNSYDGDYIRLKKIRLNKTKSRNYKDIITALVKAFDNIEIEIFTEKEVVGMKKWICNYAECDTDYDYPTEQEPFILEANDYEEAMNKAGKYLYECYYKYEFECRPYEDDEDCNLEFIG